MNNAFVLYLAPERYCTSAKQEGITMMHLVHPACDVILYSS